MTLSPDGLRSRERRGTRGKGAPGVTIRRAREEDLADVGRIYADAVLNSTATFDVEPWSDGKLREWYRAHGDTYPALVARADGEARGEAVPEADARAFAATKPPLRRRGRAVGWAAVSPYRERPGWAPTVESAVYVEPGSRGKGVGEALLRRLLDEAARAGHRVVVAQVVEGNDASLALHRKLGFEEVGTLGEVGLKFGRRLDVTILQKTLG